LLLRCPETNSRWSLRIVIDGLADELEIWLVVPGFPTSFHEHALQTGHLMKGWRDRFGLLDKWKREVAENWLSATREDAVALSQMRLGTGNATPVVAAANLGRH
jgi:hypothetical protein